MAMITARRAADTPFAINVEAGKDYWWCACGQSNNQPFCDGSHRGTGMTPVRTEITEAKKVAWCGCKHAAGGSVFCDGSHRKL